MNEKINKEEEESPSTLLEKRTRPPSLSNVTIAWDVQQEVSARERCPIKHRSKLVQIPFKTYVSPEHLYDHHNIAVPAQFYSIFKNALVYCSSS